MNSFFSAGVPAESIRRYLMCGGLQIELFYSAWDVLGAIGNLQLGFNFTRVGVFPLEPVRSEHLRLCGNIKLIINTWYSVQPIVNYTNLI